MQKKLSIIIPTLNEADQIEPLLVRLQDLRHRGHEVIVVDGGSRDQTIALATPLCDQIVRSPKSRSAQMNNGVRQASGHCFIFLHADTILPDNADELLANIDCLENAWGRFDVRLTGRGRWFRLIEACMNMRSRLTGIATGDQAIFVGAPLFSKVRGYPTIALMEDIALSKLLLNISRPVCIRATVISSSRRWEQQGIIKTIMKMWLIRLLYFFGYDTDKLAKCYD